MSRIPLPSAETLTPEQRRVYDAIASGPAAGRARAVSRPAARAGG